jgi:hypothetical protein
LIYVDFSTAGANTWFWKQILFFLSCKNMNVHIHLS